MDSKRILIIGARGQLGLALASKYPDAICVDMTELDISDRASVEAFNWSSVDIVLNAAAYTNVDGAETNEGRVIAWKVNATAPKYLADVALKHNLTLVHISTDYVFDGSLSPHFEDEHFSPLSVYGSSKAAGDIAIGLAPRHYILRTSWVIGDGKNFVRTMLGLGEKGVSPKVVNDQIGRLTFTSELVKGIAHLLLTTAPYGTYNLSNEGQPSNWADITRKIFAFGGFNLNVSDTTTEEYFHDKEGIAARPLQSVLNLDKIHSIGFISTDWESELEKYVKKELSER